MPIHAPAPEDAAPAVEAAPAAEEAPAAPALDEKELSSMKVAKLKELCQQRGLSDKGKKAELVARLLE